MAFAEAMIAPDPVPDDAVFMSDGQEFDDPLHNALRDALPRGAGLSLSAHGNRPWLRVTALHDATEILNAALVGLGRPTLS